MERTTVWDNIILESEAKRGYGECVRLWDKSTDKAIDFAKAENEYQHSVHPVDGEYERLQELLDTQTQAVRQSILDICGKYSCCSLYELWDYEVLKRVINGITEPLPIDNIVSLYNKSVKGDVNAQTELQEIFYYILREGYNTRNGVFHKFSSLYRNSSFENVRTADGEGFKIVKIIRSLYPNESDLIKAAKWYASL